MTEPQLSIDDVLKAMRDQIGAQAQEIAILKATIAALQTENKS